MKKISVPTDQDELAKLLHIYFYGSFPCLKVDGRYVAYDSLTQEDRYGPEPDPLNVITQHLLGEEIWATRATIKDSDLKRAYFAAIDVDTEDEALLAQVKDNVDDTYGEIYNWERSTSGAHAWFIFEGSMSRDILTRLVDLLPTLPPELQRTICARIPNEQNPIRLPYPGAYKPPTSFASSELRIVEAEDIARLLGIHVSEVEHDPVDLPVRVTHNGLPGLRASKRKKSSGTTSNNLWDCYEPESLRTQVDRLLMVPPVDGDLYHTLIHRGLMTKTIAAYGEEDGMKLLEEWIGTGSPAEVNARTADLRRYHSSDLRKGYWTVNGPLCPPALRAYFEVGIFESELSSITTDTIRHEVEAVLYILCVCHVVADHLCLNEWWVGQRDLSKMLHSMGFAAYEYTESGRARVAARLAHVTDGGKLPAFQSRRGANQYLATRFRLNSGYEWLLDLLPQRLLDVIRGIPKGGRHQAAGAIVSNTNRPPTEKKQSAEEDELGGLSPEAIPWDEVR